MLTIKQKNKEPIKEKGLVICHIGKGKGKTTAAMGMVARASGAGLNVYILQFVKAKPDPDNSRKTGQWPVSNEIEFFNKIKIPKNLGRIDTEICGLGFVGILGDNKEKSAHIKAALGGLEKAIQVLVSKKYQVIFLDEILSAVELGLLTEDDVVDIIKRKPQEVHLIITGHDKFPKILKLCDTVTEMRMVKHAYYQNIWAQKGIDY
jgi:cob(I)alamin adenosyltransferase